MKVIVHGMVATGFGTPLGPAPSVRDWEYMNEAIEADTTPVFTSLASFIGVPLEILTTYRGHMIHLEGGLSFHRTSPSTSGGNGMVSLPSNNVIEQGSMQWEGANYNIEVEFVV
jgi:hypothetical protein